MFYSQHLLVQKNSAFLNDMSSSELTTCGKWVGTPYSSRNAGGLRKPPERGRSIVLRSFKTEIRNTKHETNSNDKNTNDKNRHVTLRYGIG